MPLEGPAHPFGVLEPGSDRDLFDTFRGRLQRNPRGLHTGCLDIGRRPT